MMQSSNVRRKSIASKNRDGHCNQLTLPEVLQDCELVF